MGRLALWGAGLVLLAAGLGLALAPFSRTLDLAVVESHRVDCGSPAARLFDPDAAEGGWFAYAPNTEPAVDVPIGCRDPARARVAGGAVAAAAGGVVLVRGRRALAGARQRPTPPPDPEEAAVADTRQSCTRRIPASAAEVFAVVSDPQGHVDIDGSGMLQASTAKRVSAVGDTFDMHMDRRPLGDIPNWAEYDVTNVVTAIEPDRLLEWGITGRLDPPVGHHYGFVLEPVSDTETDVTNYCDWSDIHPNYASLDIFPVVPLEMMQRSLEKLEQVVLARR